MPISQWQFCIADYPPLIQNHKPSQTEQCWLPFWGVVSATSLPCWQQGRGGGAVPSWRGLSIPPSFLFPFPSFHFCINPTLECYSTCTTGHQECVCMGVGVTTFKANSETLSYPLPLHNPPHPESPVRLAKSKEFIFIFLLLYDECRGVYLNAKLFLFTWPRCKEGSLGLSTSLAWDSWTSWYQHGVGVGALTDSDRRPMHTADASGWQV